MIMFGLWERLILGDAINQWGSLARWRRYTHLSINYILEIKNCRMSNRSKRFKFLNSMERKKKPTATFFFFFYPG